MRKYIVTISILVLLLGLIIPAWQKTANYDAYDRWDDLEPQMVYVKSLTIKLPTTIKRCDIILDNITGIKYMIMWPDNLHGSPTITIYNGD